MNGGAKQGDATLVTGPSGVGKTIFGLRWLTEATERKQRCLYVTFQDTAGQLIDVAAAFGWDLISADAAENIPISDARWAICTSTSSPTPCAPNSVRTRPAGLL